MRRLAPILILSLAGISVGCKSDQKLNEIPLEDIAVATGDFDRVEEFLTRNSISHTPYEGFIFQPVYDEDADPDSMSLKVETLFTGTNQSGDSELYNFQAAFVNSGVRGFGSTVYNGTDSDDSLVSDQTTITHLDGFMARGGTLVVSDWGYDLVEAAWPDMISFLNESNGLDAAQIGTDESVIVDVVDADLASALEANQLELAFDFTYWSVIEAVGADVDVYLTGTVTTRSSDAQGDQTYADVPLLVGFDMDRGRVLFSSFAWKAQRNDVTDTMLLHLIEGLETGSGDEESQEESDDGGDE